jgi:hypothetical protein
MPQAALAKALPQSVRGIRARLMTPPECYVCTESDPRPQKSACQCTDRYIHDACLVKMLETTRHARCPVCAAPYANVSCRVAVVGIAPCGRGGMVLGAMMAAVALIGCAINTWKAHLRFSLSSQEDFVVCFAAILMTIIGVTCLAFVGRECLMVGPRGLARSMLERKRNVCVSPGELVIV